MASKLCRTCDRRLALDHFYKRGKGLRSNCKNCNKENTRNWRKNNIRRARAIAVQRKRDNPETQRKIAARASRKARLKKYGLSLEDFDEILNQQKGVCAICNENPEGQLAVDHDHNTNKIRGLLCRACNRGIGIFKDNTERLESAIEYLEKT